MEWVARKGDDDLESRLAQLDGSTRAVRGAGIVLVWAAL